MHLTQKPIKPVPWRHSSSAEAGPPLAIGTSEEEVNIEENQTKPNPRLFSKELHAGKQRHAPTRHQIPAHLTLRGVMKPQSPTEEPSRMCASSLGFLVAVVIFSLRRVSRPNWVASLSSPAGHIQSSQGVRSKFTPKSWAWLQKPSTRKPTGRSATLLHQQAGTRGVRQTPAPGPLLAPSIRRAKSWPPTPSLQNRRPDVGWVCSCCTFLRIKKIQSQVHVNMTRYAFPPGSLAPEDPRGQLTALVSCKGQPTF